MSKYFSWNKDKNELLKRTRGISFEEIELAVRTGYLLKVYPHPNQDKYPGQKIMLVLLQDYVWVVPYIEDEEKYFLKTIYPSRKATKNYLKGGKK